MEREAKLNAMDKIKLVSDKKILHCASCAHTWAVVKNPEKRGYHHYCEHLCFCWDCLPCNQEACFECNMK